MFNNIKIGNYIYKDSLIHKINPNFKILSILFIIINSMISNYLENIFILFLVLILIFLTEINIKVFIKIILSVKYLFLSIMIIDIIFKSNIYFLINNMLKIILVVLSTSILMYTTKIDELNLGLYNIFKPLKIFKIDSKRICLIITMSIKFIYYILEESDNLIKGFKSRGLTFKGSLLNRINSIKIYIGTLFYSILKKSDNIGNIIELKSYDIYKINKVNKNIINKIDYLFIIFVIASILVIKGVIKCVI